MMMASCRDRPQMCVGPLRRSLVPPCRAARAPKAAIPEPRTLTRASCIITRCSQESKQRRANRAPLDRRTARNERLVCSDARPKLVKFASRK